MPKPKIKSAALSKQDAIQPQAIEQEAPPIEEEADESEISLDFQAFQEGILIEVQGLLEVCKQDVLEKIQAFEQEVHEKIHQEVESLARTLQEGLSAQQQTTLSELLTAIREQVLIVVRAELASLSNNQQQSNTVSRDSGRLSAPLGELTNQGKPSVKRFGSPPRPLVARPGRQLVRLEDIDTNNRAE